MKRKHLAECSWQVVQRGARRLELFHEPQDYRTFLTVLGQAVPHHKSVLHGYALMSNHIPRVPQADWRGLGDLMQELLWTYSRYHNKKYGLSGTCYEGPNRPFPIKDRAVLIRTLSYVHLNPVAAGIAKSAEEYEWSSARAYLGFEKAPVLSIDPKPILRLLDVDPAQAQDKLRAIMREMELLKKEKPGTSAIQIQAMQFRWILEEVRAAPPSDLRATVAAVLRARGAGIPPRAMAMVLGPDKLKWIYRILEGR